MTDSLKTVPAPPAGAIMGIDLGKYRCVVCYLADVSKFGFETIAGDASAAWIQLGALALIAALAAAAVLNRRLPD